jgi:hypothetical protein
MTRGQLFNAAFKITAVPEITVAKNRQASRRDSDIRTSGQ